MAITDLNGVIAGAQPPNNFFKVISTMEAAGVLTSLLYTTGFPGAGAANSAGMGGAALTSLSGQIPFTNPGSGNTYLNRLEVASSVVGTLYLVDRLWHNSGIAVTTTTSQTINSVTWPARDSAGATNGVGVMVGIEVSTATTNGSPVTNTTMTYTNSAGTGSKTATISSFPTTALASSFVPFQLAAGDIGIQSIQSVTLGTSYGAGAVHLVAYRILASVSVPVAYTSYAVDALTSGFPQLYNNTVPTLLWLPSATTAATIIGKIVVSQG